MRLVVAAGIAICSLGVSAVSAADPTGPGTVEIPVVKIVGRVVRPLAAVEINRLAPALEVRHADVSFLESTERAVRRDPF